MAGWFKVSPVVVAHRALDLKLITKAVFFRFLEQDQADWLTRKVDLRQKSSGGNFYATQNVRLGRRFSAAVVRAAREGRILYQDAFRLTGMKGATFSGSARNEVHGRCRTTNELYLMGAVIEPERLVQISLGQENPRMRMNAAPGSRTIRTRTQRVPQCGFV